MFKKIIISLLLSVLMIVISISVYEKQSGILSVEGRKSRLLELRYEVALQSDSSAIVNEYRTYEFLKGKFSRGYIDIEGLADEIIVYEEDIVYKRLDMADDNRPEGFYAVEQRGSNTHVEWYFDAGSKQEKSFRIQYRVPKVSTLYNDCADYFQKYVSSNNVYKIKKMMVLVSLPEGANRDNTKIWAHGPTGGFLDFIDKTTVQLEMKNVPPSAYIEARFLMPAEVIIPTGEKIPVDNYDMLFEMETKAQKDSERESRLNGTLNIIYIIVSIFIIMLPLVSVLKYRFRIKRLKPEMEPEYYRDLPSDIYPAELDYLMNHYTAKENVSLQISVTLLDLIRKGMVKAEIIEGKTTFGKKEETTFTLMTQTGAVRHEHSLLEFLFNKVAAGKTTVSLNELKKYCKNKKTAVTAYQFYMDFKQKVLAQVNGRQFFEYKRNAHPKSFNRYIFIYLILMILPIILMNKVKVFQDTPIFYIAISAFIGFMIIAIFGGKTKRLLTQPGENQFALWKGFRNFLSDFTTFEQKELPELFMWEKYLVYATVLNVSQKLLKQLYTRYPELIEANQDTRLFYLFNNHTPQYSYECLNDIGAAISEAMRDSINLASGNSKDSGSGFSSGGSDAGGGAGGSSGGVD